MCLLLVYVSIILPVSLSLSLSLTLIFHLTHTHAHTHTQMQYRQGIIYYNFFFQRATSYYMLNIVVCFYFVHHFSAYTWMSVDE